VEQVKLPSGVHTKKVKGRIYRYSKGPDFTNDELGYGEVVEETQVPVYFPGTTEVSGAARIDLRPGASADGMASPSRQVPCARRIPA
jgi:hypothetical protein